jgi:hypothetical protein
MLTIPTLRRKYDARLDRFVISNMTIQHAEASLTVQSKLKVLVERIRDAWTKVCGKSILIDEGYTVYDEQA